MHIGILTLELRVPESQSLKDKRQVVQGLIASMRRRFNASVAETDQLDAWQLAEVGVACVANETRFLQETLSRIEDFVEREPRLEIIRADTEIL